MGELQAIADTVSVMIAELLIVFVAQSQHQAVAVVVELVLKIDPGGGPASTNIVVGGFANSFLEIIDAHGDALVVVELKIVLPAKLVLFGVDD